MDSTDETLAPLGEAKTIRGEGRPEPEEGPSRREVRGAKVGRYVVLDELGAGGMGVVYAAYDPSLDRRVALKLLHASEARKKSHRDRMLSEARALARLDAPNVVPIHDVGIADGRPFIAMEFVEGKTLLRWRDDNEPSWLDAVGVFLEAGEGLAAAHAVGLVHRDFKPENVIISPDERVRVLDFGLAVEDLTLSGSSDANFDPKERKAATTTVGTPAYMAPEQFAGQVVDHRSDQFSFCIALWETLYGERPFTGGDITALATSVVSGRINAPSKPAAAVPAELERILRRGLAKDPADRYPTMGDLLAQLRRIADRRSPWKRPVAAIAALAVVGTGITVLALGRRDKGPCADSERRLEGVWDPDTRASLEEAVRAHETTLGPQTWAVFSELLDDYAAQWVEQHRAACVATHVDEEVAEETWALQVACLNRRLQSLQSVVDLIGEGELSVVANAVATAEGLAPLGTCADVDAAQHQTPPPEPQDAAQVAAIEARLVRVKALREAARYVEAVELARRALDDAREVGYEPAIAAAHLALGRTLIPVEKPQHVHAALVEAFFAARRGGGRGVRGPQRAHARRQHGIQDAAAPRGGALGPPRRARRARRRRSAAPARALPPGRGRASPRGGTLPRGHRAAPRESRSAGHPRGGGQPVHGHGAHEVRPRPVRARPHRRSPRALQPRRRGRSQAARRRPPPRRRSRRGPRRHPPQARAQRRGAHRVRGRVAGVRAHVRQGAPACPRHVDAARQHI